MQHIHYTLLLHWFHIALLFLVLRVYMEYRAAFDDEAVKYVNEHYPGGATTVYGKRKGNQYQVRISSSLPFPCTPSVSLARGPIPSSFFILVPILNIQRLLFAFPLPNSIPATTGTEDGGPHGKSPSHPQEARPPSMASSR